MNKIMTGLDSREYEHPFDKKALNALERTPGLDTLIRKFNKYGIEKLLRIQYTGSNIKVSGKNFPEVYRIFRETASGLNLNVDVDLYIQWGYYVNAFTAGVEKPTIVLYSGCIDLLSPEELVFVIGHEVGHIKSQHVLYQQMARVIPMLGQILGSATLGIGELLLTGLELALLNWQRMSEFTADRAGLLACQDLDVAAKAFIKMAGAPRKFFHSIDVDAFLTQAKEFENCDYDSLDRVAKIVSIMWQNHPWTVMRCSEFFKWTGSGDYQKVLDRQTTISSSHDVLKCRKCGVVLTGNESFCPHCGKKCKWQRRDR